MTIPAYKPEILPSDPAQQLQKYNMDDPFVAQEISNEDLLQARQSDMPPEEPTEPFEEILESREMIEAKIFRIKYKMMDHVLRQQDIQEKIDSLENDIKILERKIEETQGEQATAIELEDYEKADSLDMRMKQTKKLIEAKENQIK